MTDPIKHVVLLMMENHSFDQMLGGLAVADPPLPVDGVDPKANRSNKDPQGNVYQQIPTEERQMEPDPYHEVPHVAVQLAGGNAGFVLDFAQSYPATTNDQRQNIMGYYPAGFLPVLHPLAQNFTVCDKWYSSLPGPTWPNRFFVLSGTSQGRVSMPGGLTDPDLEAYFEQTQTTLFDRLNDKGIPWKIYGDGIPQSIILTHQREPENLDRYRLMPEFHSDAAGKESDFPAFSFIEPRYQGIDQNDDHPPHDVMKAQAFIAEIYNALRANESLWASTLFVLLYDEHGGFYDHVIPPPAVPPDSHHEEYAFNQFGLRVPALLISPWVDKIVSSTPFDHTSLLKYLTNKWGLGPLGARTAAANDFAPLIRTSGDPRAGAPLSFTLKPEQLVPPRPDVEARAVATLTSHQKGMNLFMDYMDAQTKGLPGAQTAAPGPRDFNWLKQRLILKHKHRTLWQRAVSAVKKFFGFH